MFRSGNFLLLWVLLLYYALVTYALPSISDIIPRNAKPQVPPLDKTTDLIDMSLNSSTKSTPLVSASVHIRDSNGVDVTSSFQIKVFRQNASTEVTNLTENDGLHDRRGLTMANAVRVMDECPGNETFVESHCTPSERGKMSLQAYSYTCQRTVQHWHALTGEYMGWRPAQKRRRGQCDPVELCVDGFAGRQIASCVHNHVFSDFTTDKKGQVKGMLDGEIFNAAKMYAFMATQDESVAMKARKLGIIAWDSSSGTNGGTKQNKSCVNCVDLETDLLQPNIDSLKIEATLMSAGAIAGVLFLSTVG